MELAKSLLGGRFTEGYTDGKSTIPIGTFSDEENEDVFIEDRHEGLLSAIGGISPSTGGPFSAVTPSMWPQDIFVKMNEQDDCNDPNHQPDYRFDEFGFRVEEEDGPEQCSTKLLSQPFIEDPQHRLQWIAYLEFCHSEEVGDLTWDHVDVRLPRTGKLHSMIKKGIPHSLRPQLWMRLSGALVKQQQSDIKYKDIVKASNNDVLATSKQIEKDLLRTMPSNACFSTFSSTGIPRLRRVLCALAWLYPDIGYCQGTGMIAASLLLFMEEEEVFWLMSAIVEDILPASYYSSTLLEAAMYSLENSAQIFNALADIPRDVDDVDCLLKVAENVSGNITPVMVESLRRRHLAYLMADHGALINPSHSTNLPKQHLNKRHLPKHKSVLDFLVYGDENNSQEDLRNKNIRQTELLVDLREAVLQVARHFQSVEPSFGSASLTPDYSVESHAKDLPDYLVISRSRHRRAKALLDFERHDDDELGFRRNDLITILSQKDEHCWVGELNGLKGWFPAKFVEMLDERSKEYSRAGDDAVSTAVTDLVRGTLCPAIKTILQHGMKPSSLLGGVCHPWIFIEETAAKEVEKDFSSVYSRLVLCRTFRLDEDGKVLTPEELLYRCIQAINVSHDAAHAQMDVKLRSLICLGLNEQVLHLWLEVLCSSTEAIERWYQPWSFLRSPGWVQIKCELRILAQFPFTLNPDWELPPSSHKAMQPLREGVRDMLVKHHLFSWDL